MATPFDYARTLTALEECRWQQMQVIADAAEEGGDGQLAAGWRWLADNRKWPEEMRGPSRDLWPLWYCGEYEEAPHESYMDALPEGAFYLLPARVRYDFHAMRRYKAMAPLPTSGALAEAARAVGLWLRGQGK
jgi:hypothetical protein